MFWIKKNTEDSNEQVLCYTINNKIIGKGDLIKWENNHPFDWDIIHQASTRLQELFTENNLMYSTFQPTVEDNYPPVMDVKEKYGMIRVSAILRPKYEKPYYKCLTQLLEEYPGIEDYLEPDVAEEWIVYEGPHYDCEAFILQTEKYINDSDLRDLIVGMNQNATKPQKQKRQQILNKYQKNNK